MERRATKPRWQGTGWISHAAGAADDAIHDHMWSSLATAFALGCLAGATVAILLGSNASGSNVRDYVASLNPRASRRSFRGMW